MERLTPEQRAEKLKAMLPLIRSGELVMNGQGMFVPKSECPDGVPVPEGENPFLSIHPLDAINPPNND